MRGKQMPFHRYLISLLCVAILAGGAVYLYLTPTTLAVEDKKVNQDELAKVHSLYQEIQENYYKEVRSEEHTSELQSRFDLVCRLLLEKKNNTRISCSRHCFFRCMIIRYTHTASDKT